MKTTILLDGDIWLHRACVVSSSKTEFDGQLLWVMDPKEGDRWLRLELRKLRRRLGASRVVVAFGDRTANFRKGLYPAYKHNRAATPKPPGFHELEALIRKNADVASEPRLEGDDILGLLATKAGATDRRVVVSVDKDLLQIPGEHYNPDRDEFSTVDEDLARYRHLTQALTGDRVDGYPGLPGCGPVRAKKILAEPTWASVLGAYEKAGLTAEDALTQARLAFVLRQGFYDRKTKEISLWNP
jgi:DNA polymerase-1